MRYVYLVTFFIVVLTVSVLGFRGTEFKKPPLEVFPDMDRQAKYHPQSSSAFFADGRSDRPLPVGTVAFARNSLRADPDFLRESDHYYRGRDANGEWAVGLPEELDLSSALLERGRERYGIYCAVCHSDTGDGNGITKQYGMLATPTFHDERLRTMADGEIYNTITNGKGNMLSYADKLNVEDRWAVLVYVRALQRAQTGTPDDVPPAFRPQLGLQ